MHATDFIAVKRDGGTHSKEALHEWFTDIEAGSVADYQVSAWLMAVYLRGLQEEELFAITESMVDSGDTIDLSGVQEVVVDKHSTGGVGDTTTLVTGPIVASLGIPFAKMSGRGLGHTGGTLDKLSAIPGLRTDLTEEEFVAQVNRLHIAIAGQTGQLVPADKKLYALRDVTATIDSIPLIASSIMSKKLAVGADKILLDVKVGSGAFMQEPERAVELAKTMAAIGAHFEKETVCLITDMEEPLGDFVGNALEVYEAVKILQGEKEGPLRTVSLALAAEEILLAGLAADPEQALALATAQIANGEALQSLLAMAEAQGGDVSVLEDPETLRTATIQKSVCAQKDGLLVKMDALLTGEAALELGSGRLTQEDELDLAVGIERKIRSGTQVKEGDEIAVIYANDERKAERAYELLQKAMVIGEQKSERPLIYAKVTKDNVFYTESAAE